MQTQTRNSRPRRDASPASNPMDGLKAWLLVIDAMLRLIEQTAWETRRAGVEFLEAARNDFLFFKRRGRQLGVMPDQLARAASCGWVLTQIASGYRLHLTRAAFTTRKSSAAALQRLHAKNAVRFRDLCIAQGGAFLKVGQLLSARPDLLPAVWVETLSTLQDAAPPVEFDAVREVIESDFEGPLETLFASFEEEPVAAASIGQVHRAVTLEGQAVAVKVKRPGVDALVELDMQLLVIFLETMKTMFPPTDYDTIVTEVQAMIREELNYRLEAEHTARAAAFFDGHPRVHVPVPVPSLCSDNVLTTSFMGGEKITNVLDALHEKAIDGDQDAHRELSEALGLLLESYVKQILDAGHFQADPHPGNLLYGPDGLVVLDFGCAKAIDVETRRRYVSLVQAFMVGDRDTLVRQLDALGFKTRSGNPDTLLVFADALLKEFREAQAGTGPMQWRKPEDMIGEAQRILAIAEADPVDHLPEEFIMIARVFGTIGGLFTHYEPDVDFARHVMPTIIQAMAA